jgi:hypothetical protein
MLVQSLHHGIALSVERSGEGVLGVGLAAQVLLNGGCELGPLVCRDSGGHAKCCYAISQKAHLHAAASMNLRGTASSRLVDLSMGVRRYTFSCGEGGSGSTKFTLAAIFL